MRVREVGFQCKTCNQYIREVSLPSHVGYVKAITCRCGSWKVEEDVDECEMHLV